MDQNIENFDWIKSQMNGSILLKVKASAKHSAIEGMIEIDGKKYLKIAIKAVPEKGKANKMIIDFLSKTWKIPKQNLEISSGKTSQYKVLKIKT
jgi:hypothetical protein